MYVFTCEMNNNNWDSIFSVYFENHFCDFMNKHKNKLKPIPSKKIRKTQDMYGQVYFHSLHKIILIQ